MTTHSFENLDFSFWIDPDRRIAYLQEWEDGNWGEPERYLLPQPLDRLGKDSKLARALKAFRKDAHYRDLRDALLCGAPEDRTPDPGGLRDVWSALLARLAPAQATK